MAATAPPAASIGTPGEGVAVGGSGVQVAVRVEVGQEVTVGREVGVAVGWVGVGVKAGSISSLWPT
jgi:hypothetical protein